MGKIESIERYFVTPEVKLANAFGPRPVGRPCAERNEPSYGSMDSQVLQPHPGESSRNFRLLRMQPTQPRRANQPVPPNHLLDGAYLGAALALAGALWWTML